MDLNSERYEKELRRFLDELTMERLEQWRQQDRKRMKTTRFDRIRNTFLRFDAWFTRKFGWFFSPRRYR